MYSSNLLDRKESCIYLHIDRQWAVNTDLDLKKTTILIMHVSYIFLLVSIPLYQKLRLLQYLYETFKWAEIMVCQIPYLYLLSTLSWKAIGLICNSRGSLVSKLDWLVLFS